MGVKSWLDSPEVCSAPLTDTSVPVNENVGVSEATDRSVGDLAAKVSPSRTNSISPCSSGLFSFRSENVSRTGSAGGGGGGGGATVIGSEEPPDPPPQALSAIKPAKISDDPDILFDTISPIESLRASARFLLGAC